MNEYSLSDLAAATRDGDGFSGGAWWIVLLFVVLMGGGFWGNRQGEFGQYATAASQQEILFGQHFGQLNDRLTNIGNGICDSTFALNNSINAEGRALQSQLASCCCDIATAIHAEGETTRALIQTNEIQALRDKVSSLEMDSRFCGVVRYPMSYTYSAGNSPFCGGCCGNNI